MNQAKSVRHARVEVGFVPVPLGDDGRLYSGLKIIASPDNTATVYISPREVVTSDGPLQGFPLRPGASLEMQIDSPRLYAVSTDYQQQLDYIGA
jgi:hypothetical protein